MQFHSKRICIRRERAARRAATVARANETDRPHLRFQGDPSRIKEPSGSLKAPPFLQAGGAFGYLASHSP